MSDVTVPEALCHGLQSAEVEANVPIAIDRVAKALDNLSAMVNRIGVGEADTTWGGLECVAHQICEGSEHISSSLNHVAEALGEIAVALKGRNEIEGGEPGRSSE